MFVKDADWNSNKDLCGSAVKMPFAHFKALKLIPSLISNHVCMCVGDSGKFSDSDHPKCFQSFHINASIIPRIPKTIVPLFRV